VANTWQNWISADTSNGTTNITASTTANDTWYAGTTGTASGGNIWDTWTDDVVAYGSIQPESEEERQRREEASRRREAATARADELLKTLLTPEQVDELDKLSCFIVKAQSGKFYRIKRGRMHNIEELDTERQATATLCAHPNRAIPNADTMLAQKLMLESAEAEFLRIANRSPVRALAN
jgi:hypothetical protein